MFHGVVRTLLRPVALKGVNNLDAGIVFQGVGKAVVALDGWRRAFQSHNFHDATLAIQLRSNVFPHHTAHLVVVGTDERRVFLRVGLALEHNDGDALVEGSVDSRRDGLNLIGCHNQQVNARCHQTIYLLYLSLVAVVRCSKPQLHIVLQVSSHPQFRVLFLAPDVFRTLRHPDDISWLLTGTSCKDDKCQRQYCSKSE